MEAHGFDLNSPNQISPARTRWTPKPEQILILESIFNSGMVNPPKDETVRIRKLLEKFGSVGDANVFYWFQNRRSKSRRRQRQLQAAARLQQTQGAGTDSAIHYDAASNFGSSSSSFPSSPAPHHSGGSSSSAAAGASPASGEMGFQVTENSSGVAPMTASFCPSHTSGYNIVFINGAPTEVPKGAVDMKAMFGNGAVLVDSCGVPVLTNEFGFSVQSLQHGGSYFLVSRPT